MGWFGKGREGGREVVAGFEAGFEGGVRGFRRGEKEVVERGFFFWEEEEEESGGGVCLFVVVFLREEESGSGVGLGGCVGGRGRREEEGWVLTVLTVFWVGLFFFGRVRGLKKNNLFQVLGFLTFLLQSQEQFC